MKKDLLMFALGGPVFSMMLAAPAPAEELYGKDGEYRMEVIPPKAERPPPETPGSRMRAFLYDADRPDAQIQPVRYSLNRAAEAFLDLEITSPAGRKIAEVEDIIIDRAGTPDKIVLARGGFFGLNEQLLTIDYSQSPAPRAGHVTLPDASIREASLFSYRPDDNPATQTLSAGNVSVKEVLEGHILDYAGERVAEIEDVVFEDEEARLIVKFNEDFGMRGRLGAMPLRSLDRIDGDGKVNFQMTASQTQQFRNYRGTPQ